MVVERVIYILLIEITVFFKECKPDYNNKNKPIITDSGYSKDAVL